MATVTKIELVDDLDGETAEETVEFSLDGVLYEIDLSAANATKLREALRVWTANSRRIKGAPLGGRTRKAHRPPATSNASPDGPWSKDDRAAMRAWGAKNGFPSVRSQGRVPAELTARWVAAGKPR